MIIRCPACLGELGDTTFHSVDQAVADHVCPADDNQYQFGVAWAAFQQAVTGL